VGPEGATRQERRIQIFLIAFLLGCIS
jgi:hypothetical protein